MQFGPLNPATLATMPLHSVSTAWRRIAAHVVARPPRFTALQLRFRPKPSKDVPDCLDGVKSHAPACLETCPPSTVVVDQNPLGSIDSYRVPLDASASNT